MAYSYSYFCPHPHLKTRGAYVHLRACAGFRKHSSKHAPEIRRPASNRRRGRVTFVHIHMFTLVCMRICTPPLLCFLDKLTQATLLCFLDKLTQATLFVFSRQINPTKQFCSHVPLPGSRRGTEAERQARRPVYRGKVSRRSLCARVW